MNTLESFYNCSLKAKYQLEPDYKPSQIDEIEEKIRNYFSDDILSDKRKFETKSIVLSDELIQVTIIKDKNTFLPCFFLNT